MGGELGGRRAFKTALGAAVTAAMVWMTPTVWAAAASDLTVELRDTQPDPEVSVSRTNLGSNIVYRIYITNSSINTVNQVVFTGSTDVGAYSAFVNIGLTSPNCPAPSTPIKLNVRSVTCQVGQLKANESREFFLLFQTPTSGATITFNGHTDFSEGNSSGQKPAHFTKDIDPKTTTLTTVPPDLVNKSVKTVLAPDGGHFFTGPNGQVNSSNPWSTDVFVPKTSDVTNNKIDIPTAPPVSYTCSSAFVGYYCFGLVSTIDVLKVIDGQKLQLAETGTQVLEITLRQDASSLAVIKPIPSINDVKIFYTPDPGLADAGNLVLPCGDGLPTKDVPCVKSRTDNLAKSKKTGYYEYLIWARDNGRFSN